jgi:hypothetical protein
MVESLHDVCEYVTQEAGVDAVDCTERTLQLFVGRLWRVIGSIA